MTKQSLTRALTGIILPCLVLAACATADRNMAKEDLGGISGRPSRPETPRKPWMAMRKPSRRTRATRRWPRITSARSRRSNGSPTRPSAVRYVRASDTYSHLLDHYGGLGPLSEGLTFDKAALEKALRACRAFLADAQVQRDLRDGAFAKALKLRSDALKGNPRDASLSAKYRETVIAIKAHGDKALAAKDFARAGAANALLLRNAATFEALRPPVSFTRDALKSTVSICRENLTGAGLEEYRKGETGKTAGLRGRISRSI